MNKYLFKCGAYSDNSLQAFNVLVEHEEVKSLKVAYQVAITKAFEIKKPEAILDHIQLIAKEEEE